MIGYLFRRLLLIVPTLLGIMVVNFAIIQAAPGGPIDVVLAELRGGGSDREAARACTDHRDVEVARHQPNLLRQSLTPSGISATIPSPASR